MNILQLVEQKGIVPIRASSNKGGEYHSPCPACGGENRFHIWPAQGTDGSYWCRGCNKGGDAASYLRFYEGMTCGAAHVALGWVCRSTSCPVNDKCRAGNAGASAKKSPYATPEALTLPPAVPVFIPRGATFPAELWQQKAEALVTEAHAALLANPAELAYLAGRGLPLEAVIKNRLGWNGKVIYKSRASWGLPEVLNPDTGKPKKLWVPRGIVIPTYLDGVIHRVRVRVPKEDRTAQVPGYVAVTGSGDDIVSLNPQARAFAVVEADLDAMLIDWVAGDIVGAVALVSADVKPKITLAALLASALCILVATDYDPRENAKTGQYENPGGKAARWWLKNYPRAKRWPVPEGKDPGDALSAGVDIRLWVLAGLPPVMTMPSSKPQVAASPQVAVPAASAIPAAAFDQAKAQHLISDTFSLIASSCPPGAMEWIEKSRPDVAERLKQAEKAVELAFESESEGKLVKNLDAWRRYHLRAFDIFEARPPVIEVQDRLFEEKQGDVYVQA